MAELENLSFSIEDTMEMGVGNPELLSNLMSPETSTADPDTLEKIVKDVPPPVIKKDEKVRGKEIIPEKEGETPSDQNVLMNFLNDATDEDEDEEETIATAKKPVEAPLEEKIEEVSQFSALATDLFKLGVFSKDEDEEDVEIKTGEEFLERFNSEKKKGAIDIVNNFIGQFGPDYQEAFEAIYVKGVKPDQYWKAYNTITDFASLDLTNEENQIRVVTQSLTDQEWDGEDIDAEIERLKNNGELDTVAPKHLKVLVKKGAAKLQQMEQNAELELQQKATIKEQYIQNVQKILQEKLKTKEFDGIPINSNLINELQDFLLIDKYKTASGETLTDFDRTILELKRPENHAKKVKFALLLKIIDKDPTLSTIQRSGISKKSDQLFGELARQKTKIPDSPTQNKSWFS